MSTGFYLMKASTRICIVTQNEVSTWLAYLGICCCLSKCNLGRNKCRFSLKLTTRLSIRFLPSGDSSSLGRLMLVKANATGLHAELPDSREIPAPELGGAIWQNPIISYKVQPVARDTDSYRPCNINASSMKRGGETHMCTGHSRQHWTML